METTTAVSTMPISNILHVDFDQAVLCANSDPASSYDFLANPLIKEIRYNSPKNEPDDGIETKRSVLNALTEIYSNGFRFDVTSVRLLSESIGYEVDDELKRELKRIMFRRTDDVYFLLDCIVNEETRNEIISLSNKWLDDYGCFDVSELYALFKEKFGNGCIDCLKDFEAFYDFINLRDIRCVGYYGTRIARTKKNMNELSSEIARRIVSVTLDELGGVINENELRYRFPAFSVEVLSSIISKFAETLIRTEINGVICYQTLYSLGLDEDFTCTLSGVLHRIDELELTPSLEVINTVLSIKLGINFRSEYYIPDNRVYQRLIESYYDKAEPRREWKGGVFAEVYD